MVLWREMMMRRKYFFPDQLRRQPRVDAVWVPWGKAQGLEVQTTWVEVRGRGVMMHHDFFSQDKIYVPTRRIGRG